MKTQKKEFRLHKKYEGTLWKGEPIRNSDLTLEIAIDMRDNHPRAELLFDIVPKDPSGDVIVLNAKEKIKAIKEMESLEAVQESLEGEERATVITAARKRIEELTPAN